jgi:hypothetical protein
MPKQNTSPLKIPVDMQVGTIHATKSCGDLRVISYKGVYDVDVEFIKTGYVTKTRSTHVRDGLIKDPLHPTIYGVGFLGVGEYKTNRRGKPTKEYSTWKGMISRCYDIRSEERYSTYKECSVAEVWHNFQNFSKWFAENYPKDGCKYQIDKDLLSIGNKVYSPKTCILVPPFINSFTIDCGASRGKYLIGCCFNKERKKFVSNCKYKGKSLTLGYYLTEEEAHKKWRSFKIKLALEHKSVMDSIDRRIYPNVIEIINSAR